MEEKEYFIAFYTKDGGFDAVRVRLDMLRIDDMERPLALNLCEHPLYQELQAYVKANPR